jgi:hypothetical protein
METSLASFSPPKPVTITFHRRGTWGRGGRWLVRRAARYSQLSLPGPTVIR